MLLVRDARSTKIPRKDFFNCAPTTTGSASKLTQLNKNHVDLIGVRLFLNETKQETHEALFKPRR
jgi:hypothetical protein